METPSAAPASRVESIDLLRGIVMVLMALDHVRDWFHFDSLLVSPTDLDRTTPALFVTRWVTHLCAPTFIFLAGTSVWFVAKRKTRGETSVFLVTRGLWLVLLQMTVIRFAWNFDPAFHYNSSNIISTIGFCMVVLAALIHLPLPALLALSGAVVAGHDALDGVSFETGSAADVAWTFLHVHRTYALGEGRSFSFLYPLVPWFAVMALGFGFGRLYDEDVPGAARKARLLALGGCALAAFAALRFWNRYGDPVPWVRRGSPAGTILSFFNLEKYPPSLLYLLATLGVSFVLLGLFEGRDLSGFRPVTTFGRVALFYYVLHLYAIHLVATAAVVLFGYPVRTMVFPGPQSDASPLLKGRFGFGLAGTYLVWAAIVLALYPACRRWNGFKGRHRGAWWVGYV